MVIFLFQYDATTNYKQFIEQNKQKKIAQNCFGSSIKKCLQIIIKMTSSSIKINETDDQVFRTCTFDKSTNDYKWKSLKV